MKFLYIYIGFSILTFAVVEMNSYTTSKRLERKHPELVNEYNKNNKSGALEKIFLKLKLFIICFVPVINITMFHISLFRSEIIEERVLSKIKEVSEE